MESPSGIEYNIDVDDILDDLENGRIQTRLTRPQPLPTADL